MQCVTTKSMIRHQNFQMDSAYELLFLSLIFFIYYITRSITYIMCKHTVIIHNILYHTLCFSKCQYLPYLVISIDYKLYSKVNNKYYLMLISFTNFLMFNKNECYKKTGSACTTYKLKMEYSVLNYLSMFFLLFMSYYCSQSIYIFTYLSLMVIQSIVDLLASTVFANLCTCTYLFSFSNYIAMPIFSTFMCMLCLFSQIPQLYCLIFYRSLVYQICPKSRGKLFTIPFTKKREIKVNLLNEYNSAEIILLFRNIIVYIILCENTGQHVNNTNLGNYGLIRKLNAIHQRNILKHRFFIYLDKHIIHVYITMNITAHNVHTMGVVNHCTHFSELLKMNATCTTPTKHLCSDILFLVRKVVVLVGGGGSVEISRGS